MRNRLSGVAARVERLASQVEEGARAGCPECAGQEERAFFHDHALPADAPSSVLCRCGRAIPCHHVVFVGVAEAA